MRGVIPVVERAGTEGRGAQRALLNVCGALGALGAARRGRTDLRCWRSAVAAAAGARDLVEVANVLCVAAVLT